MQKDSAKQQNCKSQFQGKETELPWEGLEPMVYTYSVLLTGALDRCSIQLSYQGSSAGLVQSPIFNEGTANRITRNSPSKNEAYTGTWNKIGGANQTSDLWAVLFQAY